MERENKGEIMIAKKMVETTYNCCDMCGVELERDFTISRSGTLKCKNILNYEVCYSCASKVRKFIENEQIKWIENKGACQC